MNRNGDGAREEFGCFVGVDLHKTTVTLVAVDVGGEEMAALKCSTRSTDRIAGWLAGLARPRWLAVEAVGFVEWFIDRFGGSVERMDIADATELAHRRGKRRKTDRNDALDIAQRLSRGECPLGFIADEELMQLRKLGRHWRRLSHTLSRTKSGLRSILDAANLSGPKLEGGPAQSWLLTHGHLLHQVQGDCFADLVDIVQLIERQRERLRRRIVLANRSERFAEQVALCQSAPGIGDIWGCIIPAEIGPFDRFPNADALEFWSGITPDNKESAGRTQSGKITKAGSPTLRWALCNAAMGMCKSDPRQAAVRRRLVRKVGKPKANVAMGRRLLRVLYALVRDGKPYEYGRKPPSPRSAKQRRRPAATAAAEPVTRQSARAFFGLGATSAATPATTTRAQPARQQN